MGLIAPPTYIAPPAPEPHRFGLYSIATDADGPDRWELGIEWEPLTGVPAALRPHECVDLDYPSQVELRTGEVTREAVPFLVVGSYSCLSASRPLAEGEQRARLHLAAGEERAVEVAVTTGSQGNEPSFQGAVDVTPVPGTAVGLVRALGLLESALSADHHSAGAIHAPRSVGPLLAAGGLADRRGQHLETLAGTLVAVGAGYSLANVGPTGAAPAAGSAWIYATGRPVLRRSEVFVQPDETAWLDRDTNEVAIMAQRAVLVSWDGPTVAVLVDITGA